jgi:hypothetical protein
MNDPPKFVRASREYREHLIAFVQRAVWARGQPGFEFDVMGRTFLIATETDYLPGWSARPLTQPDLIFFKMLSRERDDNHWGAYWRRGKGMKVYGNSTVFERDMLFLKFAE